MFSDILKSAAGSVVTAAPSTRPRLVPIRGGETRIGRNAVYLMQMPPLWVAETMVTQAQFAEVMDQPLARDARPAMATFDMAIDYCNRLSQLEGRQPAYQYAEKAWPQVRIDWQADGYRLLAQCEWLHAAQADAETRFWDGDTPEDLARNDWTDTQCGGLMPVAQKPANPWGLFDVHGNGAEWIWAFRRHGRGRRGSVDAPSVLPTNRVPAVRSALLPNAKQSGLTRNWLWHWTPNRPLMDGTVAPDLAGIRIGRSGFDRGAKRTAQEAWWDRRHAYLSVDDVWQGIYRTECWRLPPPKVLTFILYKAADASEPWAAFQRLCRVALPALRGRLADGTDMSEALQTAVAKITWDRVGETGRPGYRLMQTPGQVPVRPQVVSKVLNRQFDPREAPTPPWPSDVPCQSDHLVAFLEQDRAIRAAESKAMVEGITRMPPGLARRQAALAAIETGVCKRRNLTPIFDAESRAAAVSFRNASLQLSRERRGAYFALLPPKNQAGRIVLIHANPMPECELTEDITLCLHDYRFEQPTYRLRDGLLIATPDSTGARFPTQDEWARALAAQWEGFDPTPPLYFADGQHTPGGALRLVKTLDDVETTQLPQHIAAASGFERAHLLWRNRLWLKSTLLPKILASRGTTLDMAPVRVEDPQLGVLWVSCAPLRENDVSGNSERLIRRTWLEAVLHCNLLSLDNTLVPAYAIAEDGSVSLDPSASGFRLLSRPQWQIMAAADTTARYWSGDTAADRRRSDWTLENCQWPQESPRKPANAWGFYDVHGNGREWVEDPWPGVNSALGTTCSADIDDLDGGASHSARALPRHLTACFRICRWLTN